MNRARQQSTARATRRSPLVWIIAFVAVVGAVFALTRLLTPPVAATTGEALPREVTVAQAAELRDNGAFVLDVREPAEWEAGHVPDSVHIPLAQLSSRMSEIPTDQQVVVICRSGNRSAQARDLLLNAGYSNVTSVAGGIVDWQAQGQPVTTGS